MRMMSEKFRPIAVCRTRTSAGPTGSVILIP